MKVEKEFLTWSELDIILRELVSKIKFDERIYTIKAIYGIHRGGLPIAVYLSHHLELPLSRDFFDYKIEETLVVDDIADTGITLQKVGNACLTATLYYKPHSTVMPTFYIRETTKWIVFPWERYDEIPNR